MTNAAEQRLRQGLGQLALPTDETQVVSLMAYLTGLVKWNKAYNLTAVRDPEQMVVKHLLDSLSILPFVAGDSLIDVGTGAGLPGMVLAIMKPELAVTLLDSNSKKTRFLKQMAAELRLSNVNVVHARAEEFEGQFAMVSSRAFASVSDILGWSAHLLRDADSPLGGGRMLAMKGQRPDDELNDMPAGFQVSAVHALQVPFLQEERHLLVIERK